MSLLPLHEFHSGLDAVFSEVNGQEVVAHHGQALAEYAALRAGAGVLDLSFRSRLCLTGADRQKFLNGQVTNNVKDLATGTGCYAAVVSAKGRMQTDAFIYNLGDELLLDFEPGLAAAVAERLEKYIIADDVQIVDVSALYGQLSVQGPKSAAVIAKLGLEWEVPVQVLNFVSLNDANLGQLYLMNRPRIGSAGFDLFVPTAALGAVADKLIAAVRETGGMACGWDALEMRRIEAGIPRFGLDMDESNLPPEAGLEDRAISYTKGCYIGQEVIARLRTYGQVARALRGLRLADDLKAIPAKGDKIFFKGKEAGFITSAMASPDLKRNIALGYVRRECNQVGTELVLGAGEGASLVRVVELPFIP